MELKDKTVLAIDTASGAVTIHAVDKLSFDKNTAVKLTPSGDNGSAQIAFYCLRDVAVEEGAKILGSIVAPRNKVELKKRVLFKGSITAREIVVGEYATVLSHQSTGSLTKESFSEARGRRGPTRCGDHLVRAGAELPQPVFADPPLRGKSEHGHFVCDSRSGSGEAANL
ncbi:MAG: hypothetical protein ONB46_21270 [candidate division KSB1 bacterium]|nr:hypothetical protein [candidate division KSB1 bacterium]MDZ7368494.1 hypothetical protein [candidate division KSB1 bacterium]MDZ7406220.1 hypothetical protein [candidate division KSB1 bacterium]